MMHGNSVLKMSGRLAITSINGPSVLIYVNVTLTHRYHRLYGYAQTVVDQHAIAPVPIIGHHRVFMHFPAYTVSGQLSYDTVTLLFTMGLNGFSDISDTMTCDRSLDAEVKTLLSRLKQLLDFI